MLEENARLGYVAGVVSKTDEGRFTRMLWRASRGNTFVKLSSIDHKVTCPKTGQVLDKSVFVVYFQAGAKGSMKDRVMKVCHGFGVNIYPCPSSVGHASRQQVQLGQQLSDKGAALSAL